MIVTISVFAELNCVSGVMYCIWLALLIWDYFSEFQPFCFHVTQKGKPKSLSTQVFISAENNLEQLERYAFLFAWSDKGTLEHYKLFFSFAGCSPSPRLSACCLSSLLFWSRQSFFQKGLLVSKFLFSSPSTTLVSFNATQQRVHQVWRPS